MFAFPIPAKHTHLYESSSGKLFVTWTIFLFINLQLIQIDFWLTNFSCPDVQYIDLPLEFPDGTTPVASHLYLFQGSQKWGTAVVPGLGKVVEGGEGGREVERVVAEVSPTSPHSRPNISRVL